VSGYLKSEIIRTLARLDDLHEQSSTVIVGEAIELYKFVLG
jgi:hypothetical protein